MGQYNTETPELKLSFTYPSTDNLLFNELRALAKLKVNTTNNDLEKAQQIIGYAHGLFTHNGDNEPSASDPLTIIKEALAGKSFRCVEYSLLATALLWAYGIPARTIGLKTKDVETRQYGAGHVVIEFWSNKEQKWIMCDVQAGIIPTKDNKPLSAVEFGENVKQGLITDYVAVTGSRFAKDSSFNDIQSYIVWVKEYLYFYDTPLEMTFEDIDKREQQIVMLVPLGTKPPVTFQGMFKMNALYTNSTKDFYSPYI